MKKSILFFTCLFIYQTLFAQTNDSIPQTVEADYAFSLKQLIIPGSLIAVGAFGVTNGCLKSINEDVKNEIAKHRTRSITVDDYLQYLPVASAYGLSLAGVKSKHNFRDRTLIVGVSYLTTGIVVNTLKHTVGELRPNARATNSFPSGHTTTAFMGAELVRIEYGETAPVYGILAYATAVGVGFLRVYNEKHWTNDVIAGAGLGILSARIGYWSLPFSRKIFQSIFCRDKKERSNASQAIIAPFYVGKQGGLAFSYHF